MLFLKTRWGHNNSFFSYLVDIIIDCKELQWNKILAQLFIIMNMRELLFTLLINWHSLFQPSTETLWAYINGKLCFDLRKIDWATNPCINHKNSAMYLGGFDLKSIDFVYIKSSFYHLSHFNKSDFLPYSWAFINLKCE